MSDLEGKVAIVTGASSGIGRATAMLLARQGAAVVIGARGADRLAEVAAAIAAEGGRAEALAGDVRDEAYAQALVETACRSFGGLDIAVNNAGVSGPDGPAGELELAAWNEVLAVNLTGAFLGAKHQLRAMLQRGGGSLVFVSSFVGHTVGFPGMTAYAAAKAGVTGLVKVLAAQYGPQGVRANALLPGGTDTPMNVARQPGADPGLLDFLNGLHALKRLADPEEIARAAVFLAGPGSSFMTGAAMLVDGGVSITRT